MDSQTKKKFSQLPQVRSLNSPTLNTRLEIDSQQLIRDPLNSPRRLGISQPVADELPFAYELPFTDEHSLHQCFMQAGVSNFDGLAFHETGCSTLQLVIEKAEGQFRDILFEKIASSFIGLAMNCPGNFLVQHALRLNEPGFNTVICETLVEHLRDLSLDPYDHYVVKEFLIVSSRETAHRVVQAIIMLDRHTVKKIWGDRHGKYVMGAAMTVPMETDLMRQLLSALDLTALPIDTQKSEV